MTSKVLKRISDPTFWRELIDIPEAQEVLSKEISMMVRSMIFSLPTSRETDALPDLRMMAGQIIAILENSNHVQFFNTILPSERLMRLFFEELFGGVVGAVYRGKLYHEKKIVLVANVIFCKLVELCTRLLQDHPKGEHPCVLALLAKIIDRRVDYYKNTGRETLSTHPFGEQLKPTPQQRVWVQETLQPGDIVDALRSTQGHKIWTRAIFTSSNINSTFCRVRYLPDGQDGYLHNKFLDIAPKDTHSRDFEWRAEIKEGHFVDVFTISKKWVLARVREVKREVVYIDAADSGGKLFSKTQRNKIFGAGQKEEEGDKSGNEEEEIPSDEDETVIRSESVTLVVSRRTHDFKVGIETEVSPFTAAVAPPGLFSQRTSSTDDSDDLFFRKFNPDKVAVVRTSLNFQTSSTLFIRYINWFAEHGGLERMSQFLSAGQLNLDVLVGYARILGSITNYLVHDVVRQRGPALLKSMIHFALLCTSENLRETSQEQLQTLIDAIESLSLRLMSRAVSQRVQNLIMLKVFLICLRSDILDKQNFALKIFTRIERNVSNEVQSKPTPVTALERESDPLADFQEEEDIRRTQEIKYLRENIPAFIKSSQLEEELVAACDFNPSSENNANPNNNHSNLIHLTKDVLGSILGRYGVFEKVIKGHASLIQKADTIMKLLFDTNQISPEQLRQLWELIQKAEADTRQNLLSLLKDCVWQIPEKYIHEFLNMFISLMKDNRLPDDCMNLVLEMRRVAHSKYKNRQISQQVNKILWGLINQENTDSEVFKRSLDSLISFSCSDSGTDDCDHLFKQTIAQIFNKTRILVSLKVITKIFKESKLENFYIGELIKAKIPSFLVTYLLQQKALIEASPGQAPFKDEKYYLELNKTLEFLEKLIPFEGYSKPLHEDPLFLIWSDFLKNQSNQTRESEAINRYARSYLQEKWAAMKVDNFREFLETHLPLLEHCPSIDFFNTVCKMFEFLNRKAGLLQSETIVMDGGYMNDYQTKTLRFHVIVHGFNELLLGQQLRGLYYSTKNHLLEESLCDYLSELLVKPRFASSSYDGLYRREQGNLVTRLSALYKDRVPGDFMLTPGLSSQGLANESDFAEMNGLDVENQTNAVSLEVMNNLNPEFIKRVKMVMLVDRVLGREEMSGPASLLSVASLKEGYQLVLYFEKESKYNHKTINKVLINNCDTMHNLRIKVSKEFSVQADCVGLRRKRDFSELGLDLNNKTLEQLNFKTGETFEFFEIEAPETPEEKLIDSQYNFTPKAIVVFSEVFSDFSTAGKMSRRQLAEFISKATDFNHCSESDDRVGNFFENYSESTNGWVDLPGFLKFYLNSSLNKKSTVYDNLRSLGYNRDLRPKYAPAQEVSSGLADTFRFKIVKSARGLTAKILEDYETYKAFMLRLLRGLKEKTQGDEKEKARTSRLTVLYVNWAKKVKGFLMTLPPSPEVIQRILFEGFSKREGLKVESEVEFYEMIVLFALLFKGKEMHTMMRTLSEQKEEPAVTSNDDLDIAAPTNSSPKTPLRKPWDSSLEQTEPDTTATSVSEPRTLLTCDHFDPSSNGSLIEQMKTWADFATSAKHMLSSFTLKFFKTDFFWFLKHAFGPASETKKIKLMMVRLLERGLLLLRCHDDPVGASNLGVLIQYTRIKKLEKERARKAKLVKGKETSPAGKKKQDSDRKTEEKSKKNSGTKDSSVQTENKPIGPKNKEDDRISKIKRGYGSSISRNTVRYFNLEKLSKHVDFTEFKAQLLQMDTVKLVEQLVELLTKILDSEDEDKKTDKEMINGALVALLCLLNPLNAEITEANSQTDQTDKEELVTRLLDDKQSNFKDCVLKGLLTRKYPIVRFFFRNFYSFLLDHLTHLQHKSQFLQLLISTILGNATEDVHFLIELAGNLFTEIVERKDEDPCKDLQNLGIDLAKLFLEFAGKFESHQSTESDFDSETDHTLSSCISFMEKILKADRAVLDSVPETRKKKLIVSLFRDCLFKVDAKGLQYKELKCKTSSSRDAALSLLSTLCVGNLRYTILVFLKGLNSLSHHVPEFKGGRWVPALASFEKRSPLGYLGIKNLGCICYMIAMLQQFFCTDAFTRGILMANDYKPADLTEVKGRNVDDNLFHQLQSLFGFLQQSRRREVNPLEFCLSYKEYNGQPVNLGVQQDSQEFLNRFFDKLETALKPTPFKGILDSVYGGLKVNVIECKGCGYVRANEELFYNLSVEAKNMNSLKQSLDKFIQPETISDFLCDNCKKKCDISKKSLLKQLPNVLIIHLQKIIFDLDFMANIKLTHRYEFENSLNLKDYMFNEKTPGEGEETTPNPNPNPNPETIPDTKPPTKEDDQDPFKPKTDSNGEKKSDPNFEYKLVGVVIHKGTAEWGHYVSLIDANKGKQKSPKWLLLDDGHVSEFKFENFKEDCFGSTGKDFGFGVSSLYDMEDAFQGANKSAYILVFDKVVKSQLRFEFSEENIGERELIMSNLVDKDNFKFEDNVLQTDFYNLGKYLPPPLQDKVDRDNQELLLEQQLMSSSFLGFLTDLVTGAQLPSVNRDFIASYYNLQLDEKIDIKEIQDLKRCGSPELPVLDSTQNILIGILSKCLPEFYFRLFVHSHEKFKLQFVQKVLERILILDPAKAWSFFEKYVATNLKGVFNWVVNSNEQIVRSSVAELIALSLFVICRVYSLNLSKPEDKLNEKERIVKTFLQDYLKLLDNLPNSAAYKKLGAYFYLLHRAVDRCPELQDFLIDSPALMDLYNFYLEKKENKTYGKESHDKALTYLVAVLAHLFDRISLKQSKQGPKAKGFKNLIGLLLDFPFFAKIVKEEFFSVGYRYSNTLIQIGCYEKEFLSVRLAALCLDGLEKSGVNDVLPFMNMLKTLVGIQDRHQKLRIKSIFGVERLEDSKSPSIQNSHHVYGLAKENNISRGVYSFQSPVCPNRTRSLLDFILSKKEHYREIVTVLVCFFVEMMYNNDHLLLFLLQRPAPNPCRGNVLDWLYRFAFEIDEGKGLSYTLMKQEIQMYYLARFKARVHDFVTWVRLRLGIRHLPQVRLFELDHLLTFEKWEMSGIAINMAEYDQERCTGLVLQPLKTGIQRYLNQQQRLQKISIKIKEQKSRENTLKMQENLAKREQFRRKMENLDAKALEAQTDNTPQAKQEKTEETPETVKPANPTDESYHVISKNGRVIPFAPPLKESKPKEQLQTISEAKDNLLHNKPSDNYDHQFLSQFEWNFTQNFQNRLFSFNKQFLFGHSKKSRLIKRVTLSETEEDQIGSDFTSEKVSKRFSLAVHSQSVVVRTSIPVGGQLNNLLIPASCLHHDIYLKGNTTMGDPAFAYFVRGYDDEFEENEAKPFFEEDASNKKDNTRYNSDNEYRVEHAEVKPPDYDEFQQYLDPEQRRNDIEHNDNLSKDNPSNDESEGAHAKNTGVLGNTQPDSQGKQKGTGQAKAAKKRPQSALAEVEEQRQIDIIRISLTNKLDQSYFVKVEFNKWEDIDFSNKMLTRGYFETSGRQDLIWDEEDVHSAGEPDLQNYHKASEQNFASQGAKLFRRQKEIGKIKQVLQKNYQASDILLWMNSRKEDAPVLSFLKRDLDKAFGGIVMKISWREADRSSFKSLAKALDSEWNWKIIRLTLPE